MSNDKTRKSLSEAAQIAQMEQWAIRSRLDKSVVEKLKNKYGPYAYELMFQAQYPGRFSEKTGYPYSSTPEMIKNFLSDEKAPTAEQIAKVVGSDAQTVQKTLDSVRTINGNQQTANPEPEKSQEQPTEAFSLTAKQKREMRGWCNLPNVKLPADETITGLVEKYGSLAYDVMKKAINEPSRAMRSIGKEPLKGSKETIQYFLAHADEITPEQLAKLSGKSAKEARQAQPAGREQEMNERVDKRKEQKQEKKKEQTASQEVSEQPGIGGHTSDYNRFRKWCYGQMGQGEGRFNCVTLDNYGHPTTGIGTLICRVEPIKNEWREYRKKHPDATFREFANSVAASCKDPKKVKSGSVAAWRLQWIKDGGDPTIFDNCVVGVASGNLVPGGSDVEKIPGAGWKVKASANSKYGTISEATLEKLFNKRFDYCYNEAKKRIKNFDAQTDYARLSAVHGLYGGYSKTMGRNITMPEVLKNLSDSSYVASYATRAQLAIALKEYNIPQSRKMASYNSKNSRRQQTSRA